MDGFAAWLNSWETTPAEFLHAIAPWAWLLKIVGLSAFTMLMVMVVGLLYSGDVQSAEKGPISIRAKPSLGPTAFQATDAIISNTHSTRSGRPAGSTWSMLIDALDRGVTGSFRDASSSAS